jgi:class 3 adenylate cyclase
MSGQVSLQEYQKIGQKMNWITMGANVLGAALVFLYLSAINPIPEGSAPPINFLMLNEWAYSAVAVAILLALGELLARLTDNTYPQWHRRLLEGESPQNVPLRVRRRVVYMPLISSGISMAMWTVAGLTLGYLFSGSWVSFFGITGVGGVLTSAIVYFATDAVWRPVISHFFPQGGLSALPAWKVTISRRLALTFAVISLYPLGLLAVTVVSRLQALQQAENPQAVISNLYVALAFLIIINLVSIIALTSLLSASILAPLQRLQNAMQKVSQNDLTAQVLIDSNDELGYVSERFNEMVLGLRQTEMLRNLLNLYISPEVARAALAEGGAQLGGTVVQSSVLFSDIRGFTSLSEQLPPQELISLLNRYMSRMVDVVITNGGIVNKFGGDSLLAVFGTPLNPAEDHAARAVKTALAMQTALQDFNAGQAQSGAVTLTIGIGIATGAVVAGNIGGEGRIEYTVIGDTVNLASRLQSLTKELGRDILLSHATAEQAASHLSFAAEPLPPLSVRGKAEPVKVFSILSF